jgi:hypothetical protein
MTQIILKDVIQITDKDILNAMAYTLYKLNYEEVLRNNELEWEDVCQEFINAIESPKLIEFYLLGAFVKSMSNIEIACIKFNSFKVSMYITDKFLVNEVYKDYFKVGLLNDSDKREFKRVGKYEEIIKFLKELQFPYVWEYEKFFRLGCSFNKNN